MKARSQQGILLVLAVIVLFVIASIASTLLAISVSGMNRERAYEHKMKSRDIAEAGLDIALNSMAQATDGIDNNGDGVIDEGIDEDDLFAPSTIAVLEGNLGRLGTVYWTSSDDADGDGLPDFDETNVNPVTLSGGEFFSYTVFAENDGIDNNDDGTIDEPGEAGAVTVIAQARYGGIASQVVFSGIFTEKLSPPNPPLWAPDTAFAAGGDLTVTGHCGIQGTKGNVHTNGYMDLGGASSVSGDATASGGGNINAGNVGGTVDTSAPKVGLPDIRLETVQALRDRAVADGKDVYVLNPDGSITKNGVQVSGGGNYHGWKLTGGEWNLSGNQADLDGFFYSPVDVHIAGGKQAVDVTIVSEGNVKLTGNGTFQPYYDQIFLLSLKDIHIAGTPQNATDSVGAVIAREQVKTTGNAFIRGVVIACDHDNAEHNISENMITGNFDVEYDGGIQTTLPIVDPNSDRYKLDPTFSAYEER